MIKKILSSVKRILQSRLFHIVAGVIILISIYLYFRRVQGDFSDIFKLDNPLFILCAIPFLIYSLISHAVAWRMIVNHFDNNVNFWQAVYIYYFSNLSRYIPGNYWHLFFKSTVGVRYGIDFSTGIKGTGIELILNTSVGFVFVVLGIVLNLIQLERQQYMWLALFLFIGVIFFLLLYVLDKKIKPQDTEDNKNTQSLINRLKNEISQIRRFSLKKIIVLILLFSSAWISQGFTFFFVLSMWRSINLSNYLLIMFSYVTAWFMGFINPIAQNGLGVREAVFMITISGIFSVTIILGAGIIMRVIGIVGELLLMFLGWLVIRKDQGVTK